MGDSLVVSRGGPPSPKYGLLEGGHTWQGHLDKINTEGLSVTKK